MRGEGRHESIPAFPTGGGRPRGIGAVQYFGKRHARRGRRAVGGGRAPPGGGPRGAVCLGEGGGAQCAGAGRVPVGAQYVAPGACILSDTGYIQVSLAKAEGFE